MKSDHTMSDPLRLKFRSIRELPSTAQLIRRVTREKHVVLEFSPNLGDAAMRLLLERLKSESPENYSIFDSGGSGRTSWVTIKEVVSTPAIIAIEAKLVDAAHHFRRTATELALVLADRAGISPENLYNCAAAFTADLPDWHIFRHGEHCCFKHHITRQTVEVSLWYGLEFGVLDPWFFHAYMSSTPELNVPEEICDDYHDMARAFSIMEERGSLVRVQAFISGVTGLVAASSSMNDYR